MFFDCYINAKSNTVGEEREVLPSGSLPLPIDAARIFSMTAYENYSSCNLVVNTDGSVLMKDNTSIHIVCQTSGFYLTK